MPKKPWTSGQEETLIRKAIFSDVVHFLSKNRGAIFQNFLNGIDATLSVVVGVSRKNIHALREGIEKRIHNKYHTVSEEWKAVYCLYHEAYPYQPVIKEPDDQQKKETKEAREVLRKWLNLEIDKLPEKWIKKGKERIKR